MSLYAISDLHLSFDEDKPMDIFGDNWENHHEKIKDNWKKTIKQDDLVLLPGDFCWAMYLQDAYKAFKYLEKLPGKKLLLKGNHDYWWTTITKMRNYLQENNFNSIDFIYNNSYEFENYIICGTRGWTINNINEENEKIYKRELLRLEISLKDGIQKYGKEKEVLVCMHYPPTIENLMGKSEFIQIMKRYNVKKCIYGHLHGESHKEAVEGYIDGIEIKLVSCDYTDFGLTLLNKNII